MTDRKCSRKFHFLNATGFFTETSKWLLYVAVRLWKSSTNEFTLFGPDKLHCSWGENCWTSYKIYILWPLVRETVLWDHLLSAIVVSSLKKCCAVKILAYVGCWITYVVMFHKDYLCFVRIIWNSQMGNNY